MFLVLKPKDGPKLPQSMCICFRSSLNLLLLFTVIRLKWLNVSVNIVHYEHGYFSQCQCAIYLFGQTAAVSTDQQDVKHSTVTNRSPQEPNWSVTISSLPICFRTILSQPTDWTDWSRRCEKWPVAFCHHCLHRSQGYLPSVCVISSVGLTLRSTNRTHASLNSTAVFRRRPVKVIVLKVTVRTLLTQQTRQSNWCIFDRLQPNQ